jgi:hypothetical protein
MAMERAGFDDVAITFRDGLIYLTSEERDRYIEVYDCRDLLQGKLISMTIPRTRYHLGGTGGGLGGGGGFFSIAAQGGPASFGTAVKGKSRKRKPATKNAAGHAAAQAGGVGPLMGEGMAPPGGVGGIPGRKPTVAQTNAQALIAVIQETVRSTPWLNIDGAGATIAEFNGLLIVTASHEAHGEIQQLLEKLRAVTSARIIPSHRPEEPPTLTEPRACPFFRPQPSTRSIYPSTPSIPRP